MKTETTKNISAIASADRLGEASKLVSLLGLAAGALAMPRGAEASIIYSNLTSSPFHVGYVGSAGDSFDLLGLPAGVGFGFRAKQVINTTLSKYYRTVTAGKMGTAVASVQSSFGFAKPRYKGSAWNVSPASLTSRIVLGQATDRGHYPAAGFTDMYLAWVFNDPTHGDAKRYGWIELSLLSGDILSFGGPDVTIFGYAWDNTGAKPAMGATDPVPEPTSGALLALGALALGARGVRSWRSKRAPAGQG